MKYCPLLLFLLFAQALQAQSFGRAGTQWSHCIIPIFEQPITYEKVSVQSIRAFTFNGLPCNTLQINQRPNTLETGDTLCICREEEKVLYQEENQLYLLYDFSLVQGATYEMRYPTQFDTSFIHQNPNASLLFTITVDSVKMVEIQGSILKRQYISVDGHPGIKFGRYITERLGFENWIIPFYSNDAAELNIFVGLQEYNDQEVSLEMEDAPCLTTSTTDITNTPINLRIFPNPTSHRLSIQWNYGMPKQIDIHTADGRLYYQNFQPSSNELELSVEGWPVGIYFLRIELDNQLFIRKLVVQ